MTTAVSQVVYGVANGSPISATLTPDSFTTTKRVTLSTSYARNPPPAYPVAVPGVAVPSKLASPQTIGSGTVLTLFADEADALVAAGAAAYS